jgi:hypothetical protein
MPSTPTLKSDIGIYVFSWGVEQVELRLERITQSKDATWAEATVRTTAPGRVSTQLAFSRVNLLGGSSQTGIIKDLEKRMEGPDWYAMIQQACVVALEKYRAGEPLVPIGKDYSDSGHTWSIYPLVRGTTPSVIYGKGGSGKSTFAAFAAAIAQNGTAWAGLVPEKSNVMYLDYESDAEEVGNKIWAVHRGLGLGGDVEVFYRFSTQKLVADVEQLRREVVERDIGLIFIDSLSLAAGGELNEADGFIRYFGALRSLKLPSITIHHQNKEGGMYGSEYIRNFARNVWEVRSEQEPGSSKLTFGLFHKKVNVGKLLPPIGLEFNYTTDDVTGRVSSIAVSEGNLLAFETTAEGMPLDTRVYDMLKAGAEKTDTLAAALGVSEGTLRSTLARHEDRFYRFDDGRYGVKFRR